VFFATSAVEVLITDVNLCLDFEKDDQLLSAQREVISAIPVFDKSLQSPLLMVDLRW
jgi:hypothetical protein